MSKEQEKGLGVRPGQVISAALAAVTAAVLGSTMGLAGTVVGAGLASVVTTIAGALYLRSLERTKAGVMLVRERVRSGVTGEVIVEREVTTDDEPEETSDKPQDRPPVARRLRWGAIVAGSVLAFMLGMLAITGYEKLVGGSLDGGSGTTIGDVIHPKVQHQEQRREDDPPVPTTTPTPSTVTVTVPVAPTTPGGSSTSSTSEQPPSTSTTSGTTTSEQPSATTTAPNGGIHSQ